MLRATVLTVVLNILVGGRLDAQQESVEVRELRAALAVSQRQVAEEKEKAARIESQRKELVKSLAEAVRISEEQTVAANEVRLKLEAFGVDLFTAGEDSLEQRLLKAVRDLDISRQELEQQNKNLQALSEAFLKYLQATPGSPLDSRSEAQEAIEMASGALVLPGDGERAGGGLANAKVVSIDSAIGLVVLNVGRSEGVRIGTPIAILRGDRPIYTAMIVDVRETICGAVLQDKLGEGDLVAVGDRIRLLPNETNL